MEQLAQQIGVITILLLSMATFSGVGFTGTGVDGAQPAGYDVFLVAGQSNSYSGEPEAGQSYPDTVTLDSTDPDIFQVGRWDGQNNQIILAEEPLDHIGFLGVRPDAELVGWALAFAKAYKAKGYLASNRDIIIVPVGEGGSGFADNKWNQGDANYNDAVARVGVAMAAGAGTNRLKAILWHQGEDETGSSATATAHNAALLAMVDAFRSDLGDPSLPFIAGGMVPAWVALDANRQTVQNNLANLPNVRRYTGYANPSTPTELVRSATDEENHFRADDMRGSSQNFFDYSTLGMAGRYMTAYEAALRNV